MRSETRERLRIAAESPRLADHVAYNRFGEVYWRDPDLREWDGGMERPLLHVTPGNKGWSWVADYTQQPYKGKKLRDSRLPTREAAIRDGLRKLANQ